MVSKIRVLALALLLAGAGEALGQGINVGVKGGVSSTNQSIDSDVDELEDTRARAGFVGGVYGEFEFGRYFSIQPEVLYSQKGFKYVGDEGELNTKVDYVEVPILFKFGYDPGPPGGAVPVAYVGGAVGFEVNCKLTNEFLNLGCPDLPGDVLNLSRKKTDFALAFGGGLDVDLDPIIVVIDVRYNLGLTNLVGSALETTAKNRAWYFMAGVGFPIQP